MEKQIKGKNGHLCIEMTNFEATAKCGFGFGFGLVCDNCNEDITYSEEPVYYIAVLNMLYCKECFDDYIENAPYYEEDKDFELEHYDYYSMVLGVKEDGES